MKYGDYSLNTFRNFRLLFTRQHAVLCKAIKDTQKKKKKKPRGNPCRMLSRASQDLKGDEQLWVTNR